MNYCKSFLMTLGHNSSVIFYNGDSAPIGYEEERLSGVKSDSSYPIGAFEKILSQLSDEEIKGSNVFISHWFDKFDVRDFPTKYFNHDHFRETIQAFGLNVICVNSQFTHHDAHAYSSKAFLENFPHEYYSDMHHLVLDGFGNNQEVMSLYTSKAGEELLTPIKRVYGYENSLGLLYQYATSYCGMKENQDEYKFLGYEVLIEKILNEDQIEQLALDAYNMSLNWMKQCLLQNTQKPEVGNDIIDFEALGTVKGYMHRMFQEVLTEIDPDKEWSAGSHDDDRIVIGYFAQACLEQCILRIIGKYKITNMCLSGGCFLNVKLNKLILDNISGILCVNPLSGDQGAAIGLFRKYASSKFDFTDLCWGKRDRILLHSSTREMFLNENIYFPSNNDAFVTRVTDLLNLGFIVNIMQGNMEFGPRALCNTSTLAYPTIDNTEYINKVNNRNEVMPMAPVILESASKSMMDKSDLNRVIGSNKFMIVTHDIVPELTKLIRGVAHTSISKVNRSGYTCRPQVIDDSNSNIAKILKNVNSMCLINTSFNTHGRPILYSFEDGILDYRKQKQSDVNGKLALVILNAK